MSVMEFFAMGGHALFVWGSYGVAAAVMLFEGWQVVRRKRAALRLEDQLQNTGGRP